MAAKIKPPLAPFRIPSIEGLRIMYDTDKWRDSITDCRALLEEAFAEYKRKQPATKTIGLPKTFKEMLDQESGLRDKSGKAETFPLHAYLGIADEANYILDDMHSAEATLACIDGVELTEERNFPHVLSPVYYQIKDIDKADMPAKVYVNKMNAAFFINPERTLDEWIESSTTDENRKEIEDFRQQLMRRTFKSIVQDIAKETGDDEAQLSDPQRRTPEQKKRLLLEIRRTIAANREEVYNSFLIRSLHYILRNGNDTKLRTDSRETILRFAIAYYFTMHPEKDYRENREPSAKESTEALNIYNKMLAAVENRGTGININEAIAAFIDGETPQEANKKEITQRVKGTATALEKYSKILQGNATNDLISTSQKMIKRDKYTGAGVVKTNSTQITFKNLNDVNFSTPCKRVFDVLVIKLTQQLPQKKEVDDNKIAAARKVSFTVQEYMNICGTKNKTQAYQQLKDALRTIYNASMKFPVTVYEKIKGQKKKVPVQKIIETRILEALEEDAKKTPEIENGEVSVYFAFGLAKYLAFSYTMPYHNELLKIDTKHHPHSYFLGRRLCLHHNMNKGNKNENRISVSTLISCCPDLPSYEEVREKMGRQITNKIIEPIERDLNHLQEKGILSSWEYCNANEEPLTDGQLGKGDFETWNKWLVSFKLEDYPDEEAE